MHFWKARDAAGILDVAESGSSSSDCRDTGCTWPWPSEPGPEGGEVGLPTERGQSLNLGFSHTNRSS